MPFKHTTNNTLACTATAILRQGRIAHNDSRASGTRANRERTRNRHIIWLDGTDGTNETDLAHCSCLNYRRILSVIFFEALLR